MLAIASAPLTLPPTLFTSDNTVLASRFANFKLKHSRSYESAAEESARYSIFVENLKLIDSRNAEGEKHGTVHGITRFADLTPTEFERDFLTARVDKFNATVNETIKPLAHSEKLSQDWSGQYTTPVKDQGHCGSCWAFSAVEQIESDAMRTMGFSGTLSVQQVNSCDTRDGGCNGQLQLAIS